MHNMFIKTTYSTSASDFVNKTSRPPRHSPCTLESSPSCEDLGRCLGESRRIFRDVRHAQSRPALGTLSPLSNRTSRVDLLLPARTDCVLSKIRRQRERNQRATTTMRTLSSSCGGSCPILSATPTSLLKRLLPL